VFQDIIGEKVAYKWKVEEKLHSKKSPGSRYKSSKLILGAMFIDINSWNNSLQA